MMRAGDPHTLLFGGMRDFCTRSLLYTASFASFLAEKGADVAWHIQVYEGESIGLSAN